MVSYYLAHVKVTETATTKITINTTGQANDNSKIFWYEKQGKQLTASHVGKIAKRQTTTKVGPTVQQLLNFKFQGNSATNLGKFHEDDSNKEHLKIKRELSLNIPISKSRLVVLVANPWLGASPDGCWYMIPHQIHQIGLLNLKTHIHQGI